jgi:DNA-binding Xre family transcriptional regulator
MSVLRVNEAIARAKTNGKSVDKKTIAALLWPDSKEKTQQVNMTFLSNGRTIGVKLSWIYILCKELDCDPNYLFGFNEENTRDERI